MPDPKPSRRSSPTTPTDYPITPNSPTLSGLDHSFLLQMMTDLKGSVSALTESIDNLKEQARDRDRKMVDSDKSRDQKFEELNKDIRAVGLDIHAAKAAGKTLLWVVGVVGALFGILITAYYQGKFASQPSQIPSVIQQTPISPKSNP